jgi:hypothetical protein
MTETRPFEPFTTSYSFTPLVVMEESLTKRASDDAFLKATLKAIVEDDSMTTADRDSAFLVVIDRYLDGVRASALAKSFASASAGCPALDRPRRLRRCKRRDEHSPPATPSSAATTPIAKPAITPTTAC